MSNNGIQNRLGMGVLRGARSCGSLIMTIGLFGCGDADPAGITLSEVAGAYLATTFEVEEAVDGAFTDQLARGATIELNLSADGSSTGRLFIPASAAGAEEFDADLTGTWSLNGPVVSLEHATNTFLVDIGFLFTNNQLMGERSTAIETIRVVLAR